MEWPREESKDEHIILFNEEVTCMVDAENGYKCVSTHSCEVKSLSRVRLFETPWTVAYQASQSMGFSRQEYWSGVPLPSRGDLPDPWIKPVSPAL